MKQKLRDLPIARKLGLLLALNTTIAVVAIALVFSVGTAITRYQDARSQLVALSEVMGETSRAALAFSDQDGARAVLQALRARLDISQATLTDRRGAVFVDVGFDAGHDHTGTALEQLVNGVFPTTMVVTHTIVDDGVAIGRIELVAHLFHIWLGLLKSLGLMVVIGVALSALAVYFGMRLRSIVVDPILGLARVSHQVSVRQDYGIRAIKAGSDEIGTLVDDFNHMLSEIEHRDEALRRGTRQPGVQGRAAHRRSATGGGRGPSGQPREVRVSVDRQSRIAHAADRHLRRHRPAFGRGHGSAAWRGAGFAADRAEEQPAPVAAHQ